MDSKGPGNFAPDGDASVVSTNWASWIEEFEAFADSKGIFSLDGEGNANMRAQRKALLLYHAGARVREIQGTLEVTERDDYAGFRQRLNEYFTVAPNETFQRHVFRKMIQMENETVSQYCARLRKAGGNGCNYHNLNDQIRDQIVGYCSSDALRKRLMEEGNDLTLERTLVLANTHESVENRFREMGNRPLLNRVSESRPGLNRGTNGYRGGRAGFNNRGNGAGNEFRGKNRCIKCGRDNSHAMCPAKGKQCYRCKEYDHFKSMCNGKYVNVLEQGSEDCSDRPDTSNSSETESTDRFAFTVNSVNKVGLQRAVVQVGGIEVKFILDSGADCNVIDKPTWEMLKNKGIVVEKSERSGPKIYSYTSHKPLSVLGQFWANIHCSSNGVGAKNTKFLVIDSVAEALLGIGTCTELGLISISTNHVVQEGDWKSKFPKLFSGGIGKVDGEITLSIDHTVVPVAQPYRRVPFSVREKLEKHLEELCTLDIIEPVEGPTTWSSGVVIVPKADGNIRLCVDMRQANKAIVRHHYPVPTVDELLLDMNGSKVFSKIDMKMGFHQFVLSEESRDITTFTTHAGQYRYKRLSFGICAAPEIYQRKLADIIAGIAGVVNLADDIVVHAGNTTEHNERLKVTLERLENAGLTVNESKCVFGAEQITFVGHRISSRGVDPGSEKVEAVVEASLPKSVGELKSFLGLVSYCSKFIPDFSSRTELLRNMTVGRQSAMQLEFGGQELEAFQDLKSALAQTKTLAFFDLNADTLLYTDASPVGLGCVLVQEQGGVDRVICYASRALTPVEKRYCQTEKEALAIVWACERLHHYLFGVKFTLMTDHQPLEVIYANHKKKAPSARIERWVLRLQSYDFRAKYIKGSLNIADCLSRMVTSRHENPVEFKEDAELFVRQVVVNNLLGLEAITAKQVERISDKDGELSYVRRAIADGSFDQVPIGVAKQFRPIIHELCIIGQIVLRGNRIVVPLELRPKMIELGHEGHLGIVGTKRNLRTRVWWPGMDAEIECYVKRCKGCQLVGQAHERDPVRVTELPNGPWEDLACDLLGPLENGSYIFVVVDYYSRFYECVFMQSTVSSMIIEALVETFDKHGLPLSLKSDNGPQFISREFARYMENMGIRHDLVTPRWPESNGEVERQNRSLMKRVRIAIAEGRSVKSEIRKYLLAYRNTPHSITGKSPSEMLFGRKLRVKVPQVQDIFGESEERDRDAEMKNQMIVKRNQNKSVHDFEVGDLVLLKRDTQYKCQTPFHHDPYRVREVSGSMLTLESVDGRIVKRNVTHVRRFYSPETNLSIVDEAAGKDYGQSAGQGTDAVLVEPARDNPGTAAEPNTPERRGPVSRRDAPEKQNTPVGRDNAIAPENQSPNRPIRDRRPPVYLKEYMT